MAKRKNNSDMDGPVGVSVDEMPQMPERVETVPEESETTTVAGNPRVPELTSLNATVVIPCLHGLGGFVKKRADVMFTSAQAQGWRAALHGMEQQEARLANGKYVRSVSDAIKYVGEQLTAAKE